MSFAIVDINGSQERVEKGMKLQVPRLAYAEGESVTFDRVLLIASDGEAKVGQPLVEGASVQVKILAHGIGPKVRVFKMKRRKRYRRTRGERPCFTDLEVVAVNG